MPRRAEALCSQCSPDHVPHSRHRARRAGTPPSLLPSGLLQVFHLADKYEAPSLMQACRWAVPPSRAVQGQACCPCRPGRVAVPARLARHSSLCPPCSGHAPDLCSNTALHWRLSCACRAVFLSDAFKLGISGNNTFSFGAAAGQQDRVEGHASWIDMVGGDSADSRLPTERPERC